MKEKTKEIILTAIRMAVSLHKESETRYAGEEILTTALEGIADGAAESIELIRKGER